MRAFSRPRLSTFAVCAVMLLGACSASYRGHGYAPVQEELQGIQIGLDTQIEVEDKIGRPSGVGIVEDDAWYYVSSVVEHYLYYEPKVVDRRVVVVRFDDVGTVSGVREYGIEDGQAISLVTQTTPTYGRELTVVRQLLGNILNVGGLASE
ncbi:MAG: outer membrane protein assembly factor BamE [Pseudomonadota bacterium]